MGNNEKIKLPPPDNYSSRKEWETAGWKKVAGSDELLDLLVSTHERHAIVMRAAALEGLAAGKSYQKIGDELWLSSQTISSIKKAADEKTYRSYSERSKQTRKKRRLSSIPSPPKRRPKGTLRHTKYGILYMP